MGQKRVNKYQISTKVRQEDRIEENFRLLKLDGMLSSYKRLAKDFFKNNWTPLDLIENLQQIEAGWDEENRVENAANVFFLGPTGVGKTHLASALGREAIYSGFDVRFLSLRALNELIDKVSDNPLKMRHLMNSFTRPKVLILDEMALFDPNNAVAKFLVELLLNRHLKSSTIFTSNKSFKNWGNAFGDIHTSAMVLDRITQRTEVIEIEGPSYRLRDRTNGKTENLYGAV